MVRVALELFWDAAVFGARPSQCFDDHLTIAR